MATTKDAQGGRSLSKTVQQVEDIAREEALAAKRAEADASRKKDEGERAGSDDEGSDESSEESKSKEILDRTRKPKGGERIKPKESVDKAAKKGKKKRVMEFLEEEESSEDEEESNERKNFRSKPKVNTSGVMAVLKELPTFSGKDDENPRDILDTWSDTRLQAKLIHGCGSVELDAMVKLTLRSKLVVGTKAGDWFKNYTKKTEDWSWKGFVRAFKLKFLSEDQMLKWQTKLQERKQKPDENPEAYSRELENIAGMLQIEQESLRAIFLNGLHTEISLKVREHEAKTFRECVRKAQVIWEADEATRGSLSSKVRVNMVGGKDKRGWSGEKMALKSLTCFNCGGKGHRSIECPSPKSKGDSKGNKAKEKSENSKSSVTCFNCGKKGHYAAKCKAQKKNMAKKSEKAQVAKTKERAEDSEDDVETSAAAQSSGSLYYAELKVGGRQSTFAIDNGATRSIVGIKASEEMELCKTNKEIRVIGWDGSANKAPIVELDVAMGGKSVMIAPCVADNASGADGLLGLDVLENLKVVIDYKNGTLTPEGGQPVKMFTKEKVNAVLACVAAESTVIPAGKCAWVSGTIKGLSGMGPLDIFAESNLVMSDQLDVITCDALYRMENGKFAVMVSNAEASDVEIEAGMDLANCEVIDSAIVTTAAEKMVGVGDAGSVEENCKSLEPLRVFYTREELAQHLRTSEPHLTGALFDTCLGIMWEMRGVFLRPNEYPPVLADYPKQHIETVGGPIVEARHNLGPEREKIAEDLKSEMVRWNVARESNGAWGANVVLIPKKDATWRMTVDNRKRNQITMFDAYPAPRQDEQLYKFVGCDAYMVCDLAKSFYHLEYDDESAESSAFRLASGSYELTRVVMGGTNSTASLNRAVHETIEMPLSEEMRARFGRYIDDLILGGNMSTQTGIDKHLEGVRMLLSIMFTRNWRISLKSFRIMSPRVKWAGLVMTKDGTEPTDTLVDAIKKCSVPESATEMRRFRGMISQMRSRIPRFVERDRVLSSTVRQGKKFEMAPEALEVFHWFKEQAAKKFVLAIIDPKSSAMIKTFSDASAYAIGGCITQGDRLGGLYSKPLTVAQTKWFTVDREYYGMHQVIMRFLPMIGSAIFEHNVDQQPLAGDGWKNLALEIPSYKDKGAGPPRHTWMTDLETLNFVVKWIPGVTNQIADFMSRTPFAKDVRAMMAKFGEGPETDMTQDLVVLAVTTGVMQWAQIDWVREQALDDFCKAQHVLIAQGRGDPDMILDSGVLVRIYTPGGVRTGTEQVKQVVVPKHMVEEVWIWFHDKFGHRGSTAMFEHIRQFFYWHGYYAYIKSKAYSCTVCRETMVRKDKVGPLLPTLNSDLGDKQVLVIDVVGPLPETQLGNRYIVYSKLLNDGWPEATVHKNVTTAEVIQHVKFRARYEGVPDEIWSDRGSVIVSEAAKSYFEDAGLKPRASTSNNHSAVGAIESEVKDLKELLVKLARENEKDWDILMDEAMMDKRAFSKTDFALSPFENRFGRKMNIPAYLRFGIVPKTLAAEEHKKLVERARMRADDMALKQKERFDRGRKDISFEVGQRVYLEDHYREGFEPRRIGPFEIKSRKSDLSYEIGSIVGGPSLGRRYRIVNARDLLAFPEKDSDEVKGDEDSQQEEVEEVKKQSKKVNVDEEAKVKEVYGHKKNPKGGWLFHVRWQDGAVTWEPAKNLYDLKKNGGVSYNEAFIRYALAKNFKLSSNWKKDGKERVVEKF